MKVRILHFDMHICFRAGRTIWLTGWIWTGRIWISRIGMMIGKIAWRIISKIIRQQIM